MLRQGTTAYMTIVFDNKPGTYVAFTRRKDAYAFAYTVQPRARVEKVRKDVLDSMCLQVNAKYCLLNSKGDVLNGYFEEKMPNIEEQIKCLESLYHAS
jgi:hypothetical protein